MQTARETTIVAFIRSYSIDTQLTTHSLKGTRAGEIGRPKRRRIGGVVGELARASVLIIVVS
jgi:hypothetical protein